MSAQTALQSNKRPLADDDAESPDIKRTRHEKIHIDMSDLAPGLPDTSEQRVHGPRDSTFGQHSAFSTEAITNLSDEYDTECMFDSAAYLEEVRTEVKTRMKAFYATVIGNPKLPHAIRMELIITAGQKMQKLIDDMFAGV